MWAGPCDTAPQARPGGCAEREGCLPRPFQRSGFSRGSSRGLLCSFRSACGVQSSSLPEGGAMAALSTYWQQPAVSTHCMGLWLHNAGSSCPRSLDIKSRGSQICGGIPCKTECMPLLNSQVYSRNGREFSSFCPFPSRHQTWHEGLAGAERGRTSNPRGGSECPRQQPPSVPGLLESLRPCQRPDDWPPRLRSPSTRPPPAKTWAAVSIQPAQQLEPTGEVGPRAAWPELRSPAGPDTRASRASAGSPRSS